MTRHRCNTGSDVSLFDWVGRETRQPTKHIVGNVISVRSATNDRLKHGLRQPRFILSFPDVSRCCPGMLRDCTVAEGDVTDIVAGKGPYSSPSYIPIVPVAIVRQQPGVGHNNLDPS
jgi:hypothetical protein